MSTPKKNKTAPPASVLHEKLQQQIKYANQCCCVVGSCGDPWRGKEGVFEGAWPHLTLEWGCHGVQEACSVYRDQPLPLVSSPAADWEPVRLTLNTQWRARGGAWLTVSPGKHTAGCRALVQVPPAEPTHTSLQWCWSTRTSQGFFLGLSLLGNARCPMNMIFRLFSKVCSFHIV